jgi:hypothetical protein
MANITPVVAATTGTNLNPLTACNAGGDTIINAVAGMIVVFTNTNAAVRNVTFASNVADGIGFNPAGEVVQVPLTSGHTVVTLHQNLISSTGTVALTYDAVTNLAIAVFSRAASFN